MAVPATLTQHGHFVAIDLYPDDERERVIDVPAEAGDAPSVGLSLYWDGAQRDRGAWEFLGVEALDIGVLTDDDLRLIDHVADARIDLPEADLRAVSVRDALCWARARAEHVRPAPRSS